MEDWGDETEIFMRDGRECGIGWVREGGGGVGFRCFRS